MVLAAVMVLSGCDDEPVAVIPPTCLQEIFPGEETFTEYVLYGSRGMPSTEITSRQSYVVARSAWAFEADRKNPREVGQGLLLALPGNDKASLWTGKIRISIFPHDEDIGLPSDSWIATTGYRHSEDSGIKEIRVMYETGEVDKYRETFFALGESGRPEYFMSCTKKVVAAPGCTITGGTRSEISVRISKDDMINWQDAFDRAVELEGCMRIDQ
jgi:hypothetical protein